MMRKKKISHGNKLKCAFCLGKGIQPGAERLFCIVCGGSGQTIINQPYSICKECWGRGRKKGANLYCLLCHGRGFVEESRYSLIVESSITRTRRKKRKPEPAPPSLNSPIAEKTIKAKVEAKKEKKSFFKKLLTTLKIL